MAAAKDKAQPSAVRQPAANADKAAVPELTKEQSITAYREMLLIRRFEEKAGQMYGMGLIGGFCHLYIGQEAVVVGMQMALKQGDGIITGYRDHGHMLAAGMDAKGVMAELTGRRNGYSKGKGGSMHMFSAEKGFYGGHGIVAAQVPLGTGLAFAAKYRGKDNVSVTYFGDGAVNQGQVYESSTWRSSGSCRRSTSSRTISTRWAPRSLAHPPIPISPPVARRSAFRANRSTAWTSAR